MTRVFDGVTIPGTGKVSSQFTTDQIIKFHRAILEMVEELDPPSDLRPLTFESVKIMLGQSYLEPPPGSSVPRAHPGFLGANHGAAPPL